MHPDPRHAKLEASHPQLGIHFSFGGGGGGGQGVKLEGKHVKMHQFVNRSNYLVIAHLQTT